MGRKEDRLWNDGFLAACNIAQSKGIQGLKDELRFRCISGFTTRITESELNEASDQIRELYYASMQIAIISVLHDQFGFGKRRVQKMIDGLDKLNAYLEKGWLCWLDVIEDIRKEIGINLDVSDGATHFKHYSRPDPEDIYDETDFIEDKAWEEVTSFLGLKDSGKLCYDSTRSFQVSYDGPYEKLQTYDFLCGVEYAVRFLGAKMPVRESVCANNKPAQSAQPEPVKQEQTVKVTAQDRRKKHRRRKRGS